MSNTTTQIINITQVRAIISDSGPTAPSVNGTVLSVKDLGPIKLTSFVMAPLLVFVLVSVAMWALHKNGLLGSCTQRKKKIPRRNLFNDPILLKSSSRSTSVHPVVLTKDTSISRNHRIMHSHSFSSSSASSIPEYSEWLESASLPQHQRNSSENQDQPHEDTHMPSKEVSMERDGSASSLPTSTKAKKSFKHYSDSETMQHPHSRSSLKIETNFMHPPPPALCSASQTIASSTNGPVTPGHPNEYPQDNYQNILGTLQHNNTWKLGGLKYTSTEQQNGHSSSSHQHSELNLKNWWNGKKSASNHSLSPVKNTLNHSPSGWWRQKSNDKEKSSMEYDSFHVW